MSHRVLVTERAERDLQEIADWLHERSSDGALRWLEAAQTALKRLQTKAGYCPLAPENDHSPHEIRNILFRTSQGRTYRAIFVVTDDAVTVTHIRGPRQNTLGSAEFDSID